MTGLTRLAVAAVAAGALAGCTSTTTPQTGAVLNSPSAVAVFRGVTTRSGYDPTNAVTAQRYRPFLAVANAGGNDLTIADASDDSVIPAPVPLRGLAYPLPGRPTLLAAADLGDGGPDLLVAVAAGGDFLVGVPSAGGSQLQIIRTWDEDGGVEGAVELGADVLALAPLPFDPVHPGTVQIAAALAGERIAVVTFRRTIPFDGVTPIDPTRAAIDPAGATTVVSDPLGFQPVDLAVLPGDRSRVFAATPDAIGGVRGVAEISLTGGPAFGVRALDALAPTRLVGAAELMEADLVTNIQSPFATALDQSAFTTAPVKRVYAVLDESRCGLQFPIACGLVTIDLGSGTLATDPTVVGSMQAPFRAPIQIPAMQAFATSGPPVQPPDPAEPQYAGTYLRVAATAGVRQTTAAAGVASADGLLTFVDLGRWDVPSQQGVRANVKATVTPTRPPETPGAQWLVLRNSVGTVFHTDKNGLTAAVGVTPGYTPTDRWTVTREGILPNLQGRRAEVGFDSGVTWLALQQTATDGTGVVQAAVRLWDPTLGVHAGDTVVIDPTGLGTCGEFEATIDTLQPPDAARPGGWVSLRHRVVSPDAPDVPVATLAKWNACVDELAATASPGGGPPFFAATFRAAGYVLVRGLGAAALHVDRPQRDVPFAVTWQDETALASACPLPPAVPWTASPPACDATCRNTCETLQRARLARRLFYLPEADAFQTGSAIAFTLALEQPTARVPRDLQLIMDTFDGKAPFRTAASSGFPVDARAVLPFDRSPWVPRAGIRFIVPFTGGLVLDGTPTNPAPDTSYTFH